MNLSIEQINKLYSFINSFNIFKPSAKDVRDLVQATVERLDRDAVLVNPIYCGQYRELRLIDEKGGRKYTITAPPKERQGGLALIDAASIKQMEDDYPKVRYPVWYAQITRVPLDSSQVTPEVVSHVGIVPLERAEDGCFQITARRGKRGLVAPLYGRDVKRFTRDIQTAPFDHSHDRYRKSL